MADRTVTVWLCATARWSEGAAQSLCLPWLDANERTRWQRFVFAADRHIYLVAHGLLRWALSCANPAVSPGDWRFVADRFGRPRVAGPADVGTLAFSLSHTHGMTVVAIAPDGAIGIDVEALRGPGDPALTAAVAAFAPAERAWIAALDAAQRGEATLRLWTLKEAYAKARGLGLHLPLDSFCFALHPHRGVLRFEPPADEDCGRGWHFLEGKSGGCRLALARRASNYSPATSRQDVDAGLGASPLPAAAQAEGFRCRVWKPLAVSQDR